MADNTEVLDSFLPRALYTYENAEYNYIYILMYVWLYVYVYTYVYDMWIYEYCCQVSPVLS